jgi:hypothetical protein
MPIVFDTSALLRPLFSASDFIATKLDSAEIKAKFANDLCRFIAADFKETLFTKESYRRLALCFGHIAHYDKFQFYDYYFHDLRGRVAFLEETLMWRPCGRPDHTYCDVERAVQRRLHHCNLLTAYPARRASEVEGAERELLRRLQAKYAEAGTPTPVLILHPGRTPKRNRSILAPQQRDLF